MLRTTAGKRRSGGHHVALKGPDRPAVCPSGLLAFCRHLAPRMVLRARKPIRAGKRPIVGDACGLPLSIGTSRVCLSDPRGSTVPPSPHTPFVDMTRSRVAVVGLRPDQTRDRQSYVSKRGQKSERFQCLGGKRNPGPIPGPTQGGQLTHFPQGSGRRPGVFRCPITNPGAGAPPVNARKK